MLVAMASLPIWPQVPLPAQGFLLVFYNALIFSCGHGTHRWITTALLNASPILGGGIIVFVILAHYSTEHTVVMSLPIFVHSVVKRLKGHFCSACGILCTKI